MITDSIILFASVLVLAKCAHLVVDNVLKLAKFFGIGEMTIGFVLLSVSTSLPELAVALVSASGGQSSISIGNVIGSNIANILIVIGACAMIRTIRIKKDEMLELIRLLFITSMIPLILLLRTEFGWVEGLILLSVFAGYTYYLFKKDVNLGISEEVSKKNALQAFLYFVAGIVGVLVSARFTVDSAVRIADVFSLSKSFIGATIIALGTSLPELAIDTAAVRKGNIKLALGDAIGSCMTNLTLVLGVTGLLSQTTFNITVVSSLVIFLIITNILFWYFIETRKKLNQKEGMVFLMVYLIFLLVEFGLQIQMK
ncbi:MAG: Inner membrane protein YrbG, predicted calcium/sodium:proton antiporter [Candidatus Fermentimicrarchaeum limneticum]|uniref:Inner membrane protein YrbG, predicted calcium/sodium:proton antiporter n=1 Tax=Fermentimicrarchaeum limneticum TaxID=2795018 RepID=A0A7D5XHE6_FERL1|nr:MAG: Inner membrane protein YrbG, predicted calcium/sodium:proton antiporter [Candidatus Fermentimicrarchaeum limneticum]